MIVKQYKDRVSRSLYLAFSLSFWQVSEISTQFFISRGMDLTSSQLYPFFLANYALYDRETEEISVDRGQCIVGH